MADLDGVLPLPTGDPQLLLGIGRSLADVASHGTQTVIAQQGEHALGLEGAWDGPAFAAAATEAQSVARLSHQTCDRLGPVVAACTQYAGALTDARRTIESLREQWHAAERLLADTVHQPLAAGADPAAGLALTQAANAHLERSRAELLARHTACVQALSACGDQAAAAVSGAVGAVDLSGIGPDAPLASLLPLTYGAQRRNVAVDLVEQACKPLGTSDPTSWTADDLTQVLGALADQIDDPMVAQALMTRLGPEGVEHAARVLDFVPGTASAGTPGQPQPLALLGLAFATSVSDRSGTDPVNGRVLAQWRPGWVRQLLERPDASVTTQLALVAAAATGPRHILSGYTYALAATRTLLARPGSLGDRRAWQARTRDGGRTITLGPAPDPYRLLFTALESGPGLARQVLLSPGLHEGQTVLRDLVVDRPLAARDTRPPLTSSGALGHLVSVIEVVPGEPLATAFLDAVGDAGVGWWQLEGKASINVDRHLDPFRQAAANLLAANPDLVGDVIDALPRNSEGEAHMQALLGEIAKDQGTVKKDGNPSGHALSTTLAALAVWEANRLGEQVDLTPPGTDPPELKVAASRVGRVLGFTAESATVALRHAGERLDAVNTDERNGLQPVIGGAAIAPLPTGHPAAAVLGVIRTPVLNVVNAALDSFYPIDNGDKVSAMQEQLLRQTQHLVATSVGNEVLARLGHHAAADVHVENAEGGVRDGAGKVNLLGPVPMTAP
ncbi:MAG: hypothetical protein ACOYBY_02350 [Dermatophilaceae bacterium]